jgi:3-oxoacyl-[acyl-carrier protein] reductase
MNILVTGGASGLGEAIMRRLASDGHKIFFTFNASAERAVALKAELHNVEGVHCDFRDPASVTALSAAIETMQLDVLINNAWCGVELKHFHATALETFRNSFERDILPTLAITQAAIKHYRKRKSGRIITILTEYVVNRPPIGLSAYAASKAYLLSMSRAWAEEGARFNIASNCISPSLMRTALIGSLDERLIEEIAAANPLQQLVTPTEVADTVAFMVAASRQINGVNLLVNGGRNVI